jgi:hypothetical protein
MPAMIVWSAAAFALGAAVARPAHAQRIMGIVLEDASRTPVVEAQVTVVHAGGAPRTTIHTDSLGRFVVAVPSGRYNILVERIGYQAFTSSVLSVGDGETLSAEIRLGVGAVPLQPLVVTARSIPPRGRAADFYARRDDPARAAGFFVTRDDIERGAPARTTDVLVRIPTVALVSNGPLGSENYMIFLRGSAGANVDGRCLPSLFIDGIRVHQNDNASVNDRIDPSQLEGVEVYSRAAFAPAEFAGGNDCGVVAFWTRVAESGNDWNWKRIGAGLASIGAFLALVLR